MPTKLVIIVVLIIALIILYYGANALLEYLRGEDNPGQNAMLLTIIMLIGIVISILIGKALIWEPSPVQVEETKKKESAKSDEDLETQIDDGSNNDTTIIEGEDSEGSPDEVDDDGVNSSNVNSISIDPISKALEQIDSNEDNEISFADTTIDHYEGFIKSEDQEDSLNFTPVIDGVYRFEFSDIPNNVSHSIYLYNSEGEELDRNTNAGNENGITARLEAGKKYIITVKQCRNTGSYTLNIGHQKPSQVISVYSQITDSIQFRDQENDYIFVPERDGLFRFEFSDIPNNISHSIYVYNSRKEELDRNTNSGNGNGITISLKAEQEYHIVVKQRKNTGSYKLHIGKQKPIYDISKYTIITDSIQYTDQENVYAYNPKNDGLYRFEFANIPNNISHSIYIYNNRYEELDKNRGIGNNNGLSIHLSANEKYYVVVKQSRNVGSYDLLIGSPKEIVDISSYTLVNDSVQFTNQQNIYTYCPKKSRDVSFTFSNLPEDVSMNLYIYNSQMEELDKKAGIGNDSGINIFVDADSTYYIVVEQRRSYGSYLLNIY